MTKADLAILERAFTKEIEGALSHSAIPPIIQSKSKRIQKLVDDGYLEHISHIIPSRFGPIVISGYVLTLLGNFTYCMSCDDEVMP